MNFVKFRSTKNQKVLEVEFFLHVWCANEVRCNDNITHHQWK